VLGWSGDAVQLQKDDPNIEFVMPKEGCMLWSTSMEIPVGAPNPAAAEEFINFVYDPKVQADIAEWVNYVTPVEGVQEILRKRDPKLAEVLTG
jgi:spermidine/putrescine transport system substrate-binding protein